MDKGITTATTLYTIKDIMLDHKLTLEQAFYLICNINNVDYDLTANELIPLYNKSLIKKNKVNTKLLFRSKDAPEQQKLDLNFESKPKGTEFSLKLADRLEKEFVLNDYLSQEERAYIANKYFKGDLTVARYYIIFKSLFPIKNKKKNMKWNNRFGFSYDGIGLWDDSLKVARKFHEIYRKKDIGVFLVATFKKVKDSTQIFDEKCFMTKPFKFLTSYDDYYRDALDEIKSKEKAIKNKDDNAEINNKLNL